ncbi:MAG: MMPL family transporter [Rickettsiales bacterium]|nr:MMPL family transporter [Rickettsiales bacterium]
MNQTSNPVISLAQFIIRFRILIIISSIIIAFACAYGMKNLAFDTNYRAFFSDQNPQLQAFDELQKVYTKTDNIVFVIQPKDGNIFSPQVLTLIQQLTEESWKLPFSKRVDSLTNYQHTSAEGDDLTVADLVEDDPFTLTQADLDKVKEIAQSEPLLVGNVVARDLRTTGVNITFNFPKKSIIEVPTASTATQQLADKYRELYPDITIVASGLVSLNNAFSTASQRDIETLIPAMYGVIIITMLLLVRNITVTFTTILVIIFSIITAMGIAGWSGIRLTPPSASAPTIILTLAIADSIHIIISMLNVRKKGMGNDESIIESIRVNFQPIFLTSITTAIGFLTLNFSDSPPFHDLGNITAMGVIAAFLFSVFFLPAFISVVWSIFPAGKQKKVANADHENGLMERFANFVINQQRKLLIGMAIVVMTLGISIPKIVVDDQWLKYFSHSIPFRGEVEFLVNNLTGVYTMEYSVGAEGADGISSPEYLSNLEAYTEWLREQPEVAFVFSVTDIFKRLNKNMHGDNPDWYRIPDNKEMAAQYLLLYEFSLPYGLDLTDRINIDKSASRVSVTLKGDVPTSVIRNFKDKSEQWLIDNAPSYMHSKATSPAVMFAYIAERNINSMLKGNVIALFLISMIIIFALKSLKIGLISLAPNLIPPIMGFGVWALLIGEVNMAVAAVLSISLGVIVDDTVHFLSKYNRARNERGLDAPDAIRYAFSNVGTALTVTSFILIAGFSILIFSAFQMNSLMGSLTAIIIGCALVADFLLLPPLLMYLDKKKRASL